MSESTYEPVVIAFCCTYCSYTAADLAGGMRLRYPTNVRVVKLPCTGKVSPNLLLETFRNGADIVYVAGCNLGDCHFLEGNVRGKQAVQYTKKLLAEIGIEPERLEYFHIPASAGPLFAEVAETMTARGKELGPVPFKHKHPMGERLDRPIDGTPPLPVSRHGRLVTQDERNDPEADKNRRPK